MNLDKSHLFLNTMHIHAQTICFQKRLQLTIYGQTSLSLDFPFLTKEREVWGPLLELLPLRSDPG